MMLFLIFDNHIIQHGNSLEDLRPKYRDMMERALSSRCGIYIDGQPIKHTLPKTIVEKLDVLDSYLLNGRKEFEFKSFGRYGKLTVRTIMRVEEYKL